MKKSLEAWRVPAAYTLSQAAMLITCNNPDDWNNKEELLLTDPPNNFNAIFKQLILDSTSVVNSQEISHETGGEYISYVLNLDIHIDKPNIINKLSKKEQLSVNVDKYELLRWLRLPHQKEIVKQTAWFFDDESETEFEESQTKIPLLRRTDPYYPSELDIAIKAWQAVTANEGKGKPKARIIKWLDANFTEKDLSIEARGRIAILVNWDKKGGASKTY